MSKIEWTEKTWNPIAGCDKVSPGCDHCYALTMSHRLSNIEHSAAKYGGTTKKAGHKTAWTGQINLSEKDLSYPLKIKKPTTFFVNSMSDLFHVGVPFEYIDRVFAVMALCPQHTFQILTKRPERMTEYWADNNRMAYIMTELDLIGEDPSMFEQACDTSMRIMGTDYLPNVWLGTSVEDQKRADERIPHLLACPAAVRFLSCEPLLGPITLECMAVNGWDATDCLRGIGTGSDNGKIVPTKVNKIHWVITGGESGHGARPSHPDWIRSIRDQCAEAGVPFFFKQWGEWASGYKSMTDGVMHFRQFENFGQWVDKASTWVQGGICLDKNGQQLKNGRDFMGARDNGHFPVTIMHKVGKKAAGSLLDGIEHKEYPNPINR